MDYYISKPMRELAPSAIREILKHAGNPEVISLAAGDPAPESLPVGDIQAILSSMLEENPLQALLYSQSEGFPPLRELVKKLVASRYSSYTQRDELIITSGAQQAMDICTRVLCDEGDTVICENPSFIGSLNTFRSYGVNLVGVEIESDGINIAALEQAIKDNPRTRLLYLIPNFQNPTGITMSLEKRKAVYQLALKHNILILEDNPYGDLRFSGETIPTIKSMDTEGIVIYVGSFSKILSTGIRVGYLVAPVGIMGKIVVAKQCADVHTSMLSQLVCYNFLDKYDLNAHIESLKPIYKEKAQLMLEEIERTFPTSVSHTVPEGGLFVWCKLPNGTDSTEFVTRLVTERKVCVVPGSAFTASGDAGRDSFRMNFSMPSKENIKKGVSVVGQLLRESF